MEVPRLRLTYITGERMTPAHLRASCAIPCGFPPVRIAGQTYVDGGLLGPVPLWAALEMGATSAVVVNVLEFMPSLVLRTAVGAFRSVFAPKLPPPTIPITWIRPSQPLGTVHDALCWNASHARRWIELGECDAAAILPAWQLAENELATLSASICTATSLYY